MNILKKFIVTIFGIILSLVLLYCLYFNTLKYSIIIISALVLLLINEKLLSKSPSIVKIFFTIAFFIAFVPSIEMFVMFHPAPIIATTNTYEKAREITAFIAKKGIVGETMHIEKDYCYITLSTDNRRVFDNLAIAIADSPIFDDTVKIGVMFKPSEDMFTSDRRLEHALDKRFRCIKGVNSAQTSITYHEENGKVNPDLTTVNIEVYVDEDADQERIYKIVNNFLPMPDKNKKITIKRE